MVRSRKLAGPFLSRGRQSETGGVNLGNDVGWINQMHTEHHGYPLERTPVLRLARQMALPGLLQGLQISDDVVDILAFGEPSIRHAVTLHLGLRVLDVLAQIIFIPNEVCALHWIRVAEILKRGGLASDHPFEARAKRVGPFGVACGAGLIQNLAMVGIGRCGWICRERDEKKDAGRDAKH